MLPPINLNKNNNTHFNLYLNKPIASENLEPGNKLEENFFFNQFETSLFSFTDSSDASNEFRFKYITNQFESTSLSLKKEAKSNITNTEKLDKNTDASSLSTWIVLDTMKNGDIFVIFFLMFNFQF
jgi:hypothetical protein